MRFLNPSNRALPSELTQILRRYVDSALNRMTILVEDPYDTRLSRLKTEQETLKEAFIQKAGELSIQLDHQEIIDQINEEIAQKEISLRKAALTPIYPDVNFDAMDVFQLRTKHMEHINQIRVMHTVNNNLKFLVEKAHLPNDSSPNFAFSRVGSGKFRISAQDVAMGYSLHLLQVYAKDIPPAENRYQGALHFEIDLAELKAWNTYLRGLTQWHADFHLIMQGIIGPKANEYIKTGQKSLDKIIEGEQKRPKRFIDPPVLNQMRRLPGNRVVLLMTQVALDFTNHPHRDEMRACFERMYREAIDPITHELGLCDNKREKKTFVIENNGYKTYLSGLAIIQIEAIFSMLMANAIMPIKAREMGFNDDDAQFDVTFRALFPSDGDFLYQYMVALIQDMDIPSLPSAKKQAYAVNRLGGLVNATSVQLLPALDQTVNKMLNEYSGVCIKYQRNPSASDITSQQKCALMNGSVRKDYPTTPMQVSEIFNQLKATEVYQRMKEDLQAEGLTNNLDVQLDLLCTRLSNGLQSQGESFYDGNKAARRAVEYAMNWIARIVYQQDSKVTDASIKQSLKIVIAVAGDGHSARDLAGCNRGLWGRLAEIASTLVAENQDAIQQAFEQKLKEVAENVFSRLPGMQGRESSMYAIYKQQAFMRLGLLPERALMPDETPMPISEMNQFLQAVSFNLKSSDVLCAVKETVIENFKAAMRDGRDDDIYMIFKQAGFLGSCVGEPTEAEKAQLEKEFRMISDNKESPWNLSLFSLKLSVKLVGVLFERQLVQNTRPGCMACLTRGSQQEFILGHDIPLPQPVVRPPVWHDGGLFQRNGESRPAAPQQSSGSASAVQHPQIDLVARSENKSRENTYMP